MGKASTFAGSLTLIIGLLFVIGWIGAGMAIEYIDSELEENCDSTTGQIGQVTGWDDNQCQDGRDTRKTIASLQAPMLYLGIGLLVCGGVIISRS
jgi:hypothetical protein|tara:strand:+ start:1815 stop:2099 length:285 start_codon:yes stop_codon:yes gene_type:complete